MQLSQAEASSRHCTGLVGGKEGACVGSTPPTAVELANGAAARAAALADVEAQKREQAAHRLAILLLLGIDPAARPVAVAVVWEKRMPGTGNIRSIFWLCWAGPLRCSMAGQTSRPDWISVNGKCRSATAFY